ncbi:MAG: hypothetical protein GC158_00675 [Cyanobacteria bacterium RI_101]|nr:hypothetical protein [Cyanobacteria bacterium RI_101]
MTISEWIYPGSAVATLVLGGGLLGRWRGQLRRREQELLQRQETLSHTQEKREVEGKAAPPQISPQEETLYLQGKIHHLERDLIQSHTLKQEQDAQLEELRRQIQQREVTVLTLQNQVSQQESQHQELARRHQAQVKDLHEENDVLSQRLQQEVAKLSQWRQQASQLEPLQVKYQALQTRLGELERQLSQQKETFEAEKQAQGAADAQELAQLRQAQAESQSALEASRRRLGELEVILTRQKEALEQTQAEYRRQQEEGHAFNQEIQTLRNALHSAESLRAQQERDYLSLQTEKETLRRELASLQSQLEEKEKLLAAQAEALTQATLVKAAPEPELPELTVAPSEPEDPEPAPELTVEPPVQETPEVKPEEIEPLQPELTIKPPVQETPEVKPEAPQLLEPELTVDVKEEPSVEMAVPEPEPELPESTVPPSEPEDPEPALDGKKFVIAGTLARFNREEIKTRLQAVGAQITNAPSSKTDYVVVGKAPGEKLKKAQKLGVAQLTEAQFLKLLGVEEP